ncbi:hypothetical protein [Ensifer aridi]|uniref:hypothetical protein n=1 Tax=Ensifer aridi TaxID=1708715 RepID=UPI000A10A88A|nr:hypothetical protein [Ensifer aridi]
MMEKKLDFSIPERDDHPANLGMSWKGSNLAPEVGRVGMLKSEPGFYYDQQGNQVSEAVARLVGFDVEANARIRFLKERKAQFDRELEEELRRTTQREAVVVAERGGYAVVEIGAGYFNTVDLDGKPINARPVTHEAAMRLFGMLAPEENPDVSEDA